jgi:hypothetical protein
MDHSLGLERFGMPVFKEMVSPIQKGFQGFFYGEAQPARRKSVFENGEPASCA